MFNLFKKKPKVEVSPSTETKTDDQSIPEKELMAFKFQIVKGNSEEPQVRIDYKNAEYFIDYDKSVPILDQVCEYVNSLPVQIRRGDLEVLVKATERYMSTNPRDVCYQDAKIALINSINTLKRDNG